MDGKPAAVHIVRLFTQQIEQLGVAQGNEEIEGIVGVRHDDEQSSLAISQGVQFQLVIGGQVPQLLNIKRSQPCAAGNQDGFCCFASDVLSRTFSSFKKVFYRH